MSHDSYAEEPNLKDIEENSPNKNDQESLKVEDYSKIIEELQSHRKEIEKLQMDMSGSITNTPSMLNHSSKSQMVNNEFFPFCPLEELQQQLDDIIDDDVSGKEGYITADDFYPANQGFKLRTVLPIFLRLFLPSSTKLLSF